MPYLLEDLVIDRVDLVDEGANSAAFITLYKRKEQSTTMGTKEILEKMKPEHAAVVQKEIDSLTADVAKAKADLATANATLTTTNDELTKVKSELNTLKGQQAPAPSQEEILKTLPKEAQELITKLNSQKAAAEEALRKAQEAEVNAAAVAKAAELKALPIEQAKLVGLIKNCSPEMLELLGTISKAIEGTVLTEVGKTKPGEAATAGATVWSKIEAKADEIAKAKGITKAKAITQVINDNPELYREYLEGGAN